MAKRRKFSGRQKVEILRRHLLEGESVSDVCDEYELNPSAARLPSRPKAGPEGGCT